MQSYAPKNALTLFQKVATHFKFHTLISHKRMTKQECTLFTISVPPKLDDILTNYSTRLNHKKVVADIL